LVCEDPFSAYNTLTQRFQPFENVTPYNKYQVGEGTIIEPNVTVGEHVKIGKNCLIRPNVVIHAHTTIGDNVIIHSGTVIGTDAFYYKGRPDGFEKWHSCGRVIIENNVEIGALTTIDKGVSGDTIIGEGTKIDNHCHIGHGVVIGKKCLLAAQVGVAGKTVIEDSVVLLGQVGVSKSLRVGAKSVISAQSGVSKSLEGGKAYFGSPAVPIRTHHKEKAALRKLPELLPKLIKLVNGKKE
jgi:UDP-3-O-[3-hydroxymyristoyl] glucosamine N-acyltransferase